MKFDAIVGNPPYQFITNGGVESGKSAKQAKPIFQRFVSQAKEMNPRFISMIVPARWYNGGMGMDSFREEMLNDTRLSVLYDYYNSKECFPTVDIAGGLCYFLWDQQADGPCMVVNVTNGEKVSLERNLNQFSPLFIRDNNSIGIVNKILSASTSFLTDYVSAIDTFGIPSKEKGHEIRKDGDVELLHSVGFNDQGVSYIERSKVTKNADLIDKWKVKISIMVPQGGEVGIRPENGYRSISTPQVLPPGQVDTFSYLNVGFFDSQLEAENYQHYLQCKFTRFLLRCTYSSVHITRTNFAFVPVMDFTRCWNDKELYEYFHLTPDEAKLIEATMRPMG